MKTNLASFTNMLQGQRDLGAVCRMLLSELTPLVQAQCGVIYQVDAEGASPGLKLVASYADDEVDGHSQRLALGQGLIGQCAADAEGC